MSFASSFIVIGHRGAAGLVPENTLPSFQRAFELGVDAIELDVHRVEHHLAVIHDDTLERTTNGKGPVADLSLADLKKLDAGGAMAIPLLDEVLDALPGRVAINIELKGRGTAALVADILRNHPRLLSEDLCMVSSFDHLMLLRFRQIADDLPISIAPLYHEWRSTWRNITSRCRTKWLNLSEKLVTAVRMHELGEAGLQVLAYTVNTPGRALELQALGVRGVFTDRPDLLVPCFRPSAPADPTPA